MDRIRIKIYEDDYTDWFGGKKTNYVIFEPDFFKLVRENFGEKIRRIEVFEKDEFIIRIYSLSYGKDLGKLSETQILRLAGLFSNEVEIVNYYSKYYSPQSSRLFNLKNFTNEYSEIVRTMKPKHYEVQDNVLIVYLL